MKRSLIVAAVVAVLLGSGYFFYKYMSEQYVPKKKRDFYVSKYEQKQNKKLYKRELFHENIDDGEAKETEASQDLEIEPFTDQYKTRMRYILDSLEANNLSCRGALEDMFTQDSIVDAENELFSSPDNVILITGRLYLDYLGRPASTSALGEFVEIFQTRSKISASSFYRTIRSTAICRDNKAGLYLETVFESMEKAQWNASQLQAYKTGLLEFLYSSLEEDVLPDNILFVLNGLRLLGTSDKLGDDFFRELDDIYSRISQFEDGFFNALDTKGVVQNPARRLESYLLELELLSDDIQILIGERFSSYNLD